MMENKATRPQIKLEFGFSTSPKYERAVAMAQNLTGYKTWGEGRKQKQHISFSADQAEDFLFLMELVRDWKSTSYWLDEKDLGSRGPWQFLNCIRNHEKSFDSSKYCGKDNYWGCRQVGANLTAGHFEEEGIFKFDKKHYLFDQNDNLQLLSACPFFKKELMLERLEELDEEIDPRTSENWDYILWDMGVPMGVYFVPLFEKEAKFAELEERGEKAWRTRLLSIPDEKWQEYTVKGHVPDLDVYLEQGWTLVTVIERNEVWYCVLKRE